MATIQIMGRFLEIGQGAACFAGHSSFFSQVMAWGFFYTKKNFKSEIEAIEHFYRSLGHLVADIELCPLAGIDLFKALGERGYKITEINNVSFLNLEQYRSYSAPEHWEVRQVTEHERDNWARQVALGFGHLEAKNQFYQYAGLPDVTPFAVFENGQIVAGATVAIHADTADLGVTSTVPSHRGKGLQKLLLNQRLLFAKQQQVRLAVVTTEPGSISDLNIQKMGFQCAYNRIKLTKTLKDVA